MKKLIAGVQQFQSEVFESQKDLFQSLSQGQQPHTLFITCSDSRIDPSLITQTVPGELFMLRNVGNIVPPYHSDQSGEAAVIEYAVSALNVQDIVVCGHSQCGAMNALLHPSQAKSLPAVSRWLEYAEPTRNAIQVKLSHLEDEALLVATIEENVIAQLQTLAAHPVVAEKLSRGELRLHGWVYHIKTGEIMSYDAETTKFVALEKESPLRHCASI